MTKGALILQGGGMRCVYTSGVLDTLLDYNIELSDVYGISAGSKNGIYYLSKQKGEAIKVDIFCSGNKKAISLKNYFLKGGVISASYYKDYILKELAPVDEKTYYNSEQEFHIGATNCLDGSIKYFTKKDSYADSIIASCSLPLIQSMKEIDGIPYLDGGIAETISLNSALKDGHQKIVIVLTREKGYFSPKLSKRSIHLYKRIYHKYPELVKKLITQNERHNQLLKQIYELEEEGKIFCIYPSSKPNIKILEKNKENIMRLYNMGKKDAEKRINELIDYLNKE